MVIFILITGGIFLIINYIYSSIFSRTDINENFSFVFPEERYLYNNSGSKLSAGFDLIKDSRQFAVLYYGYGSNSALLRKLKDFYQENGYSVIGICADAFYLSEGKKKCNDSKLSSDLELWLHMISAMYGSNISIILHGFSYTALSCLMINTHNYPFIKGIVSDCACIFPCYLYKHIKPGFLRFIFEKKSRINLSVTDVPVMAISDNNLKRDAYKAYSLCTSDRALYIFENRNLEEYISKLNNFITRLKQPEGSA